MTKINLFDSAGFGELKLKNRIVMSPLTRSRSPNRVANTMMAEYYSQRASAGLIIAESTSIEPMGVGYADTPGIWTQEQMRSWQLVTRAVQERGGVIVLQLWHVGRISDPCFLGGERPVAPSPIAARCDVSLLRPKRPHPVPRGLESVEISSLVKGYKKAAELASKAGFDGVEIHAANGYLVDQFLQDGSNRRQDRYGGSIEGRARFLLEVTDAVVPVWGCGRVGVHLSPRGDIHDMGDSNSLALFRYVARELGKRRLAFLFVREREGPDSIGPRLKKEFGGAYIANEDFTQESAEAALFREEADAVAFGRAYIANPDLVERFRRKASLNTPDFGTFQVGGAEGYLDYPTL